MLKETNSQGMLQGLELPRKKLEILNSNIIQLHRIKGVSRIFSTSLKRRISTVNVHSHKAKQLISYRENCEQILKPNCGHHFKNGLRLKIWLLKTSRLECF